MLRSAQTLFIVICASVANAQPMVTTVDISRSLQNDGLVGSTNLLGVGPVPSELDLPFSRSLVQSVADSNGGFFFSRIQGSSGDTTFTDLTWEFQISQPLTLHFLVALAGDPNIYTGFPSGGFVSFGFSNNSQGDVFQYGQGGVTNAVGFQGATPTIGFGSVKSFGGAVYLPGQVPTDFTNPTYRLSIFDQVGDIRIANQYDVVYSFGPAPSQAGFDESAAIAPTTTAGTTLRFTSVPSGAFFGLGAGASPTASARGWPSAKPSLTGAQAFDYSTTDGSLIEAVTAPTTLTSPVEVSVGGIDLGSLTAGQTFFFASNSSLRDNLVGGLGVVDFTITGPDLASGLMPVSLVFNDDSASVNVTAVPDPSAAAILCYCVAALVTVGKKRGHIRSRPAPRFRGGRSGPVPRGRSGDAISWY